MPHLFLLPGFSFPALDYGLLFLCGEFLCFTQGIPTISSSASSVISFHVVPQNCDTLVSRGLLVHIGECQSFRTPIAYQKFIDRSRLKNDISAQCKSSFSYANIQKMLRAVMFPPSLRCVSSLLHMLVNKIIYKLHNLEEYKFFGSMKVPRSHRAQTP